MMFAQMMYVTLGWMLGTQGASAQEDERATAIVERLAARAAVQRSLGTVSPGVRIVLDPMMVHPDEAPGGRDAGQRSAQRNADLARTLGARVRARSSVIDCSARPCVLRDADVLVTLSQPIIVGDKAHVTVTTNQRVSTGRRNFYYQTVNVLMKRRGHRWQVVGFEDLGIS